MSIFVKLKIRATNISTLIADLRDLPDKIMDKIDDAVTYEAEDAKRHIQMDHFASYTGDKRFGAPLRTRSAKAMNSINFRKRRTRNKLMFNIGALDATPKTKQYFETQEIGRTIGPQKAWKLAFPSGDASWPMRNGRGVQLMTAREFLEDPERWGYDFVLWKPRSLLGHQIGQPYGVFDVLFRRRPVVRIPRRAPVGSEMPEMHKNILDQLRHLQI